METNINAITSDDDDMLLFQSLGHELANKIILIKHNDPNVGEFCLYGYGGVVLNERAWLRLGHILGQNTNLAHLEIEGFNLMDVSGLCERLQNNRCIRRLQFHRINLRDPGNMNILAPFLSHNPILNTIVLTRCNLSSAGINILSDALAIRTKDTIETLDLSDNRFGDIDLDGFSQALSRITSLRALWLNGNGIGRIGCTSLIRLLKNQESNLEWLYLDDNSIDDDCVIILAGYLVKNTKLKSLFLSANMIGTRGWSAILKLICNCSSINSAKNSNHTLSRLWSTEQDDRESFERAFGADDANLLRASLNMNQNGNKMLVARCKILWSHAHGDMNLGDSDITTYAMPSILAWIGNDTKEDGTALIQYQQPSLSESEFGPIVLDSIYRILRCRPELCGTIERAQEKCKDEANSTHLWTRFILLGSLVLLIMFLLTVMSLTVQLKLERPNEL